MKSAYAKIAVVIFGIMAGGALAALSMTSQTTIPKTIGAVNFLRIIKIPKLAIPVRSPASAITNESRTK